MRALLFLLCFFAWVPSALAQFFVGDTVEIGDQGYEVIRELGKGGRKTAYLARKPNCTQNCQVVLGISTPSHQYFNDYNFPLQYALNSSPSPHIRREIPMVRGTVKGYKGEIYMTVMEYGSDSMSDAGPWLKPSSLKLLFEDAYKGVDAIDAAGVLNTDIKPGNMVLMGDKATDESVKAGRTYAAIADHDALYKSVHVVGEKVPLTTPGYFAPEMVVTGESVTSKSALWELSASFFVLVEHELMAEPAFIYQMGQYLDAGPQGEAALKKAHEELIRRVETALDRRIEGYKFMNEPDEVEALKDIKKMILNGLQLKPGDRLKWPAGVTPSNRVVHAPPDTERLHVAPEHLIRTPEQIDRAAIYNYLNAYDDKKNGGTGCLEGGVTVQMQIWKAAKQLDLVTPKVPAAIVR